MSEWGRPLDVEAVLAGADPRAVPPGHRSGLVALVGRPNVGKSTLLNAMVGRKLAIVTDVPGTTRTAIRGILTRDDAQLVFVDTPGLAKPRTLLTRRLNDVVRDAWSGVDVICFLVDVADGVGGGDRYLAEQLPTRTPTVIVANKEDAVRDKDRLIPQLAEVAELLPQAEVVPTSATTGANVDRLLEVLVGLLPEGPLLFPEGVVTDQPERVLAAELLREQFITRLQQELPHSVAVVVESIRTAEHRDDLVEIEATVFVERDSQKGIVIGRGGEVIKAASSDARAALEAVFGRQVFLQTRVKVAKEWQRDPKQLGRLGY